MSAKFLTGGIGGTPLERGTGGTGGGFLTDSVWTVGADTWLRFGIAGGRDGTGGGILNWK